MNLVFFHAHPDDECIATGGVMALAAAAGHRVTVVFGTRGEHGEPVEGVLADGEQLGPRRAHEAVAAAEVLGVSRVEFLGYLDSGMIGEPTNDAPGSFWSAPVEGAAARLALILAEESAELLTVYDDHGGYGHPDHIQVHRVGVRAAEMVGIDRVFQSTINRTAIMATIETLAATNPEMERPEFDDDFGVDEEQITHAVDVSAVIETKRKALRAHASQVGPESLFLAMDDDSFMRSFGTEWFIELNRTRTPGAPFQTSIL